MVLNTEDGANTFICKLCNLQKQNLSRTLSFESTSETTQTRKRKRASNDAATEGEGLDAIEEPPAATPDTQPAPPAREPPAKRNNMVFKCNQCPLVYSNNGNLTRHLKSKH